MFREADTQLGRGCLEQRAGLRALVDCQNAGLVVWLAGGLAA